MTEPNSSFNYDFNEIFTNKHTSYDRFQSSQISNSRYDENSNNEKKKIMIDLLCLVPFEIIVHRRLHTFRSNGSSQLILANSCDVSNYYVTFNCVQYVLESINVQHELIRVYWNIVDVSINIQEKKLWKPNQIWMKGNTFKRST